MPNVLDRPYASNFQQNSRPVVKHTPDALIYINGDIAIPGCPRCNGRIDIQRFVKQISIEAGTNPGAHSGQAQLSVPLIYGEQMFREGKALLQPSLEVHVYMRGYFPVSGQFAHLRDEDVSVGANSINLDRYATYPYYHVFHGVITSVSWNYSDGFYDASIQFGSLLHFWQYHNMATNGSILGTRPNNTEAKMNLWGNIYSGMHPYAIIYDLYRTTSGNAGGIEFVLNDKSNLDATAAAGNVSGGGQANLYKQMQLYWEERFKTSIQNLRMYGVNGRLYNSVQQAFIGRRNSTNLNRLLKHTKHQDLDALDNKKDWSSAQLALANRLGLQGDGLDVVLSPTLQREARQQGASSPEDSINFNITSIFAFTPNITSAQIQEFETQYMTKLEIAQQVTNATGYEFYQDVDGDLVFKPPFYNLDTRGSRIYRLEDIDIISASFQEKEPEATYCTVKAGVTTGFSVGTPGWVGARGQYIDWRLVAKFGWRPANMEVSYYNSPKALFFLAQARLDILNITINSATVTIPLRPELRPGFPVYIPFVDCFYYVTQLSHSFSYGANCTTSLTLTARRAKWMPPGVPGPIPEGENAIERVRLDEPWLPERPLEIYDNGFPRWVGMPNVVMALDPYKVNPKYFMLRAGLEGLDTEITGGAKGVLLANIIREQVKNTQEGAGIFSTVPSDGDNPTERTRYRLRQSDDPADDIVFSLESLYADATEFDRARKDIAAARKAMDLKAADIRRSAGASSKTIPGGSGDIGGAGTNTTRLQADFATASAKLAEARAKFNPDGDETTNTIVLLIQALANNDFVRQSIDGIPDAPPTAAWLDILSDTKSSFLPGTNLPGYYRYYSCAHPNPEMQGQATLAFDEGAGTDLFVAQERTLDAPAQPDVSGEDDVVIIEDDEDEEETVEDDTPDPIPNSLEEFDRRARELGIVAFGRRPSRSFFPTTTIDNSTGLKKGTKRLVGEFPDATVVQNALNIGVVAQEFHDRVRARIDASGSIMRIVRAWAPSEESFKLDKNSKFINAEVGDTIQVGKQNVLVTKEKKRTATSNNKQIEKHGTTHTRGIAVDIQLKGPYNGVSANVDIYREVAATMALEGRITGLGFYGGKNPRWHMHMDIREYGPCPQTWFSGNTQAGNETQELVNATAESLGVPTAGVGAARRKRGNPCPDPDNAVQAPPPPTPKRPKKPKPAPPPTTLGTGQVAKIRIEPAILAEPRYVEGFKRGALKRPPGVSRAPEAELGRILVERGVKVVQARTNNLRVVATSEIQTLTFTRSETKKSINVAGLANEQGLYEPTDLQAFLVRVLSQRFKTETQDNIGDATTTPRDFLSELYDQIREELLEGKGEDFRKVPSAKTYPVYQKSSSQTTEAASSFIIGEFAVVQLPTFENAVTIEGTFALPDVNAAGEIVGTINLDNPQSIADDPLSEVSSNPGFSGKQLGQIVDKVTAAYVGVIVKTIVANYEAARVRAGFVQGKRPHGWSDRMSIVTDAFSAIALTATQVQFEVKRQNSEARALRAAKRTKGIYTPVFPVSDGGGYEHIGSFRYGRGLTIEPGGTFEFINNSGDFALGVSAATAEAFLSALTSVQAMSPKSIILGTAERKAFAEAQIQSLQEEQVTIEQVAGQSPSGPNSLVAQRLRTVSQVRLALIQLQAAQPDAVRELMEANGVDEVETIDYKSMKPNMFETRFANFPANQLQEAVFKTTVANAAFNLSDLEPHLQQKVHTTCACQGSSAHILLQAYGRNDFMSIAGIDPNDNPATASLSEQILLDLPDYLGQRQALRGQQLDTRNSSLADIFKAIKDIRNTFTQAGRDFRGIGSQFREAGAAFRDIT